MGRASRWLSRLLGGKKDSKAQKDTASSSGYETRKDRKRWSFTKQRQADSMGHSPMSATDVAWLRSLYDDGEDESKHAIALAVATAAAANAAVTAAHAAMVRLKSLGRDRATMLYGNYERWAAVKIQTAFRCYLARKALRALKGLVKLQALVRGYLVRKQAAITLRRFQALMRAQYVARSKPAHVLPQGTKFFRRRSFERFNVRDTRCKCIGTEHSYGCDRSPKIVEMDTFQLKSKSFRRVTSNYYSALEEPMTPISPPLQYKILSQLSIPSCQNSQDYHYGQYPEKSPCSKTAHTTPRLWPETPVRSGIQSSCPSYMANTSSFAAKVRTESVPKQRPEKVSPRKKLPADEMEFSTSLSGTEDIRSVAYDLKNGMVGKVDRSATKVVRGVARDYYLDSLW